MFKTLGNWELFEKLWIAGTKRLTFALRKAV